MAPTMAGNDNELQLFAQCRVCIVCSKTLPVDAAQQIASTVEEHGGEVLLYDPPSRCPPIEQFTHLMACSIDFPEYDAACDALIPVVKSQWAHASLSKRKLANPRQYSPDPRLFLNDVVVTCGDIPDGDKDAIIGGVLAKGGVYSPRLTALVTHLVDLSMESDKARLLIAKRLNAKIVLPHWFDDCLKLGRRIDERPYTLPNPEILRADPDAPVRLSGNRDIIGASAPEPKALSPPPSPPHLNVFEGKTIMFSPDLGIGPHLQNVLEALIRRSGGTVITDVFKTDMLICRYREGFAYRVASRLGKDVGNLSWLYHLMTFNTWTSPLRRLLHYPLSRTAIPGFKGLKISLSNYVGEARTYLEHLIAATGAESTKTLKPENTHLITAHDNSEKCGAAKEWGLHVINHLWLEESYARWKMQPVSDPRYTHFPRRTNLGEVVGQTRLDKAILERLFYAGEEEEMAVQVPPVERRVMKDKDQNAPSPAPKSTSVMPPPLPKDDPAGPDPTNASSHTPKAAVRRRKVTDDQQLQTPVRLRTGTDDKENDIPSTTSSRKSKEAAAARLQEIAPDIALFEKERKRVGGVIYGGRRKTDEDRVAAPSKKRPSLEPEDESDDQEEVADAKRQKRVRRPVSIYLVVTGYQKWVGNMKKEDAEKRQLRDLGIEIVQDARKCTHLAAPSILRTPKFVNALAYGPIIVNIDFITQCLKEDELLDPADFPLRDSANEEKYGFSLSDAAVRAKGNKNKLLEGYHVYCVESIRGGFDTFKSIVEANGGSCALFRGRITLANHATSRTNGDGEDEDMDDDEEIPGRNDVYLLSGTSPDQLKLWPRFRQMVLRIGRTPHVVRVDWLLDIAMSQELRVAEEYELHEEMVETAGDKADEER